MACRTESKTIGDHEYSVTQWPAQEAILNKIKLLKIFGPAFGAFAKDGVDDVDISGAIESLFAVASPEEILSTIRSCIIGVGCDGKKITVSRIDEIFSGDDLLDFYRVFAFVVQVNYSNLFKGQLLSGVLAKAQQL